MIGIRRSAGALRSKNASSERRRAARISLEPRRLVHEGNRLNKSTSSYADTIRALCADGFDSTADRMTARAALGSVEKVIGAESYLKDAALSLAQEEKLDNLLAELHDVADALSLCQAAASQADHVSASADIEDIRPALPSWWFALSETMHACEREIDFVASIGRGQRRDEPARNLCNAVVRVLRKHYQKMLSEAEDWMDMTNG